MQPPGLKGKRGELGEMLCVAGFLWRVELRFYNSNKLWMRFCHTHLEAKPGYAKNPELGLHCGLN